MSNSQHPPRPPRYKLALLTWVGAYAVITLILQLLGPTMTDWPLAMRTLAISALMVAALTWLVIPTMTRLFRGWLIPATPPAPAPCAEEGRTAGPTHDAGPGGQPGHSHPALFPIRSPGGRGPAGPALVIPGSPTMPPIPAPSR